MPNSPEKHLTPPTSTIEDARRKAAQLITEATQKKDFTLAVTSLGTSEKVDLKSQVTLTNEIAEFLPREDKRLLGETLIKAGASSLSNPELKLNQMTRLSEGDKLPLDGTSPVMYRQEIRIDEKKNIFGKVTVPAHSEYIVVYMPNNDKDPKKNTVVIANVTGKSSGTSSSLADLSSTSGAEITIMSLEEFNMHRYPAADKDDTKKLYSPNPTDPNDRKELSLEDRLFSGRISLAEYNKDIEASEGNIEKFYKREDDKLKLRETLDLETAQELKKDLLDRINGEYEKVQKDFLSKLERGAEALKKERQDSIVFIRNEILKDPIASKLLKDVMSQTDPTLKEQATKLAFKYMEVSCDFYGANSPEEVKDLLNEVLSLDEKEKKKAPIRAKVITTGELSKDPILNAIKETFEDATEPKDIPIASVDTLRSHLEKTYASDPEGKRNIGEALQKAFEDKFSSNSTYIKALNVIDTAFKSNSASSFDEKSNLLTEFKKLYPYSMYINRWESSLQSDPQFKKQKSGGKP